MTTIRFIACLLMVSAFAQLTKAQYVAAPPSRVDLISTLTNTGSTTYEQAKACQRLAVVGDQNAVPPLAGLLNDPELSVYALSALQRIPGTKAEAALVAAIDDSSGRALAGILHAVGQRRIAAATPKLADLVAPGKADAASRQAAMRALGRIGGDDARKILTGVEGKLTSKLDRRVVRDAITQIDSREKNATDLQTLAENIASQDEPVFRSGLQMARRIGAPASDVIEKRIDNLSPARQSLALICLGEIGGKKSLAAARKLMDADDPQVVLRAVQAITKLNGWEDSSFPDKANSMPEIALSVARAKAEAGHAPFDEIARNQIVLLASGDMTTPEFRQQATIEYVMARRFSAATESLLEIGTLENSPVRRRAIEAIGSTVSMEQFPHVLGKLLSDGLTDDVALKSSVLQDAAIRLPREPMTLALSQAMQDADADDNKLLMKVLGFLGGTEALQIVVKAARSDDDASVDAATQVLGEWLTSDVAAPLLSLAKDLPAGKYQIRALRGYLRVGRQLDMPMADRMMLVKTGYDLATRENEQLLAVEIVRRNASEAGMNWLVQQLTAKQRPSRKVRMTMFNTLASVAERLHERIPNQVSNALKKLDFTELPPSLRAKFTPLINSLS